ncbi:hypothetical protein B0H19DRAFT_1055176 [Mycena capillaripes]|nr:hypothetical protein B0H19DRAFT_1055176 [Mycena capillaripes]
MTASLSQQEEAEVLILALQAMNKGQIDKDRTLLSLTGKPQTRGFADVAPETPSHERVARHIDAVLATRQYFAKKRIFAAQGLEDRLKQDLESVYRFLRAARRSQEEHFIFPDPEERILRTLDDIRGALAKVEDMVVGNSDIDATAPDSEAGDETKVDFKYKVEA